MGLLNTFAMASAPVMTTIFTTISGISDVRYALIALLAVEAMVVFVAVRLSVKVKRSQTEAETVIKVSE